MGIEEHRAHAPSAVGFAVVTVSSSRTEADDASGRLLRKGLSDSGHHERYYRVVPDSAEAIREAVKEAARSETVEAILLNGGTGVSPRDVTWEALEPLLDRQLPGFGELFRSLSFHEIGSAAMLSRAFAGVIQGRILFALPGSPAAVRLALEQLILPELGHLVGEVTKGAHGHRSHEKTG